MNQFSGFLFGIFCILIWFRSFVNGEGMIYPTRPVRNAILDSNSKSLLTLYFRVSTKLAANNYLRIQLPDYGKTGFELKPKNCLLQYFGDTTFTSSQCGIMKTDTIYVQLSKPVQNDVTSENILQIELDTLNPIDNISQSLRVSTISSIQDAIFFQYDENYNFGQIPFTMANNDIFQATIISYGVDATRNIPGQANKIKIQIEINKSFGIDQNMSRIKLIASSPWVFDPATTVTTFQDARFTLVTDDRKALYVKPQLILDPIDPTLPKLVVKTQVETPNQLSIVFNQGFKEGSAFIIEIDNLLNPSITAQGVLKIYTLPVNSNESVEQNDQLLTLQTFQTPINVQILTSLPYDPINTPINFYKNTKQYVTVNIDINSKTIQANYPILLQFTPNTKIIKGSEYLDSFMKDSNGAYIRQVEYSGNNIMIIRNIAQMVGTNTKPSINIQTRVLLSKTDAQFSVQVFIYTDSTLKNPQFSGVSNIVPLKTNYPSVIKLLTDTVTNQQGFITSATATPNDLIIDIQVGVNDILVNSKLVLYVSNKATQLAAIACTIDAAAFTAGGLCTYTVTPSYVKIEMQPNSFTNNKQRIKIDKLKFSSASNHEDATYELFFRLIKDITNPTKYYTDFMIPITVIKVATPNIDTQAINDLNQSLLPQLDYSFPSFIDVIDKADTFSGLSPAFNSATQRYFIALYSSQGFESIALKPSIGQQFYCGSSLSGVSCYYKEKDDTSAVISPNLFKEWSKIIFFLPTVTKVGYHMIIPFLFDQNTNYIFQVELGYFNINTFTFDILQTQAAKSYTPTTSQASVQSKCDDTQISLSGNAGAQVSNVQMQISCNIVLPANSVSGQGASAILVTDWEFWFDNSSRYTIPVSPNVGNKQNDPVSVKFIDKAGTNRFAVIFPLILDPKTAAPQLPASVYIDNVVLPFSYDLPNLLFIITQFNGKLNCYKQYSNSGRNLFYESTPQSLLMSCISQADGVQNTQCTITFQPAQNIQRYAVLVIQFQGMQANTNECTLLQRNILTQAASPISQSCSVSIDSSILTVQLADNQIYSNDYTTYSYELSFYGVSIDSVTLKGFIFEIRDLSGKTAIEQQTINVPTTKYSPIYIQVSQLIYKYLNPYVFSQLTVQFATPRELLPNENVVISLGSDLSDVNSNTDRLTVTLFKIDSTNPVNPVLVPVGMAFMFSQNTMQIQLTDRTQFTTGDYKMIIDGILTPASNSNDLISIRFIRNYDEVLVLQNILSTSVPFPTLLGKSNSDITLTEANFLMEGSLSEFVFNITMKNSQIISSSIMYVYFPIYYSPSISNFPDYIYCRMNNIQIPCKYNDNPFRLELTESPLFIQPGQNFTLLIQGQVAPQYTLRNNPRYINETIFFAVDTGSDNSFSEFIHLQPPKVIQIPTDYPYMRLISAQSLDTNTRALSTHTFLIQTEIVLPIDYGFQVIFPIQYQFLKITSSLQCMISYNDQTGKLVNTDLQTCDVRGLSVEGILPVSINAQSRFTITIQNVPTPPTAGFVDISRTIIGIFPSTREYYITQTNYLTNQMGTIQFVEQTNFVSINAGKEIQVTKGTYSPDITIETANKNKFVANMVIDVSAKGFTFIPPSMNIYLGDLSTSFRVGADKNLLEKQYTVDITKKEFGFSPIYQIANNLIVFVISQPIDIMTPASITVPYQGCSLPYTIVLTSTPFDDVNISIQYDYNQLPEGMLVVDIELSSYTLYFDSQTNYRYLSLCTTKNFPYDTLKTFPATLSLGGSNIESFNLINPNLVVNVVKNIATVPNLILTIKQIFRTSTQFAVDYNVDGTIYWQVYVKDTSSKLTLSQIKEHLKTQRTVLQQPTTLEQQFFGQKTDERVGLNVFRSTDAIKYFEIKLLIPETDYVLCTYFENELGRSTGSICLSFKTSDGNSCSLQAVTLPYYFKFQGKTATNSRISTNIYLIPDADLENDSSIDNFAAMYDPTTKAILASQLTLAITQYNIKFIQASNFKLTFSYNDAINKNADFIMPTINNIKFVPVAYNFNTTIEIQDITLSSDGQVYFIAEMIAKVLFDNVKGEYYDAPISEVDAPAPVDIINCRNKLGYQADKCARAVYNNNNQLTLILDDLVPDTKYAIYYVIANHFPITPIYDQTVTRIDIISLPFKTNAYSGIMSIFPSLAAALLFYLLIIF